MLQFIIIELEDGLTVAELQAGQKAEDAAVSQRGVLADPQPYPTYEEANDALIELQSEDEDEPK